VGCPAVAGPVGVLRRTGRGRQGTGRRGLSGPADEVLPRVREGRRRCV